MGVNQSNAPMHTENVSQKAATHAKDADSPQPQNQRLDDLCAVRRAQPCPNRAGLKGAKAVCEREVIMRQRILEHMRDGETVASKDVLESPYCLYSQIKRGHIHADGVEREYHL